MKGHINSQHKQLKGQLSFSIFALGLPELWLAEPILNKA